MEGISDKQSNASPDSMSQEKFLDKLRKALSQDGDFPTSAKIVSELKMLTSNPNTTANQIAEVYRESRTNQWLEMSTRGLEALNVELTNQTAMIAVVQHQVDKMKAELGISDIEIQQGYTLATVESEALRKQDAVRIEAKAEYEKLNTQYSQLTNYTRVELKRAMLTVVPDQHLNRLHKLAGSRAEAAPGPHKAAVGGELLHPPVLRIRHVEAAVFPEGDPAQGVLGVDLEVELAVALAGAPPVLQQLALRREDLEPHRRPIDHPQLAVRRDRDRR